MGALTQELPKPMLRVEGRPILEHILDGLLGAGIREVCFITGWRAEVIESHFGDGSRWGARITYARQEIQNGTGKAPEHARAFVGDSEFLLTYGDILVRPETYRRMRRRWEEDTFAGLLTVTEGQDVTQGGLNFFDDQFRLTRLVEKPSPAQLDTLRATGWLRPGQPVWYNAGIYLFRPSLFTYTARLEKSPRGEYELTDAISAMIADGQVIAGLPIEGRWVDVRDPSVLATLQGSSDSPAPASPL
ncbi:MAG: nucleotidyltransferase family protein [Verrucomicrobia bacterium]|nr:nucleotidyltransferase family protein [Verrucomicrobiota bacterium]